MPTGHPPASRNSGLTRVDMIAALLELEKEINERRRAEGELQKGAR